MAKIAKELRCEDHIYIIHKKTGALHILEIQDVKIEGNLVYFCAADKDIQLVDRVGVNYAKKVSLESDYDIYIDKDIIRKSITSQCSVLEWHLNMLREDKVIWVKTSRNIISGDTVYIYAPVEKNVDKILITGVHIENSTIVYDCINTTIEGPHFQMVIKDVVNPFIPLKEIELRSDNPHDYDWTHGEILYLNKEQLKDCLDTERDHLSHMIEDLGVYKHDRL